METGAPDGQVLAGRYEIGAVLGRGGMAEVRAGWDRRLGRAVAIKTLLPGLAEEPGIRQRFEGEARAAARLAHPNAVAVFDVGEEHGVPFLVMEQVVGPTLDEELRRGPLDAGRLRRLGAELLAALGAAHSTGLVHRDVKPANVLMAPDGSAKLADFGIAKAVVDEETATHQVDLTTADQTPGTVAYMAPERLAGQPATVQSDLYSVGVVLYESLTGARPFAAPTPIAMVRAIDQASPVPLQECCPGLDPLLVAVVERAMAKNPEDRFASAAEMSAALRAGGARRAGATDAPTVIAPAAPRAGAQPSARITDAPTVIAPAAPTGVTSLTSVTPVPVASLGQRGWRRAAAHLGRHAAGHLGRRRIAALATVAGLAIALIAVAVGWGNPKDPSGGTPAVTTAVTAPPPTLLPENPTSTNTATTPTGKPKGKGKGKG